MLFHLPESRAIRPRRTGGGALSIAAHVVVIAALVSATAHATAPAPSERIDTPLTYTDITPPPTPPAPSATSLSDQVAAAAGVAPDITAPVLVAPIDIPNVLPDIDFSRAPTNPDDFASGRRAQTGGIPGGTGNAPTGVPYMEWQVERPVAVLPGTRGPQYPAPLKDAGIEGTVLAQFVVDTLGRADMRTFRVLQSDHAFFINAVKQALPAMRFLPAEVGERKVPQVVQQAFQFRLDR